MIRKLIPVALALGLMGAPGAARAEPSCAESFPGYTANTATQAHCNSAALGGVTAFSYYVPDECTQESRCPVLYLLHGFDGDDQDMIGTPGDESAFVRALTTDLSTGLPADPLSFILVAPEGRTVGPSPQESFWVDWNPALSTNAPKFEEHVTKELVALVDGSLPTIASRAGRAIAGVSLGGFGAFKLAFQHPDLYANAGSISGALNILVAPGVQPVGPGAAGTGGLPADTPEQIYVAPPRVASTPPGFPFGDPFRAFGDPVRDEAYYRGNNPLDLAVNARGVPLRFFSNNAVPGPADFASPQGYIGAQALEAVVLPMNAEMVAALTQHDMDFEYELHDGLHSGTYWDPHIRAQLEWQYARVSHPGSPLFLTPPETFDYRSIRNNFSVWGWQVSVDRGTVEFLTLWDASRDSVTVTGSGTVTIVTPPMDITGVSITGARGTSTGLPTFDGRAQMTFTIAPQQPTDEHAGASGVPGGEGTVRICFEHPGDPPGTCPLGRVVAAPPG